MKTCTKCGESKPLDKFNKHIGTRDKLVPSCKVCQNKSARAKYAADPAKTNAANRARYHADPEKRAAKIAEWKAANPEQVKKIGADWALKNRDRKNAAGARQHTARLNATPVWSEREAIDFLYAEAARDSELIEVDHVIPLQGATVCGLHCLANLELLARTDNRSKSNKFDQSAESQRQLAISRPTG